MKSIEGRKNVIRWMFDVPGQEAVGVGIRRGVGIQPCTIDTIKVRKGCMESQLKLLKKRKAG
jgi:hypothetical protein